jgi:hypothetical protein
VGRRREGQGPDERRAGAQGVPRRDREELRSTTRCTPRACAGPVHDASHPRSPK